MATASIAQSATRATSSSSTAMKKLPRKLVGSFSVYLLTPTQAPYHLERTYIGFSTNPFHRRRQHNGEIKGGAWRTRRYRPWEIVCVLTGFKDNISALQFEWLWQHPYKSKLTKEVLSFHVKGKRGVGHENCVKRKLIELFWILSTKFKRENGLALHFVSETIFARFKDDPLLVKLPSSIKLVTGEHPDLLAELYLKQPRPKPSEADDDDQPEIEVLANVFEISGDDDDDDENDDENAGNIDSEIEIVGEIIHNDYRGEARLSSNDGDDDDDEEIHSSGSEQYQDALGGVEDDEEEEMATSNEAVTRVSLDMSAMSLDQSPRPQHLGTAATAHGEVIYLTEDSETEELCKRTTSSEKRRRSGGSAHHDTSSMSIVHAAGEEEQEDDDDSVLDFDFRRPRQRT